MIFYILLHLFPNSCYSKSTDYYLPKVYNLRGAHTVALRYTRVNLDSWYMIYHIKEYILEVIKQNLASVPYPTS